MALFKNIDSIYNGFGSILFKIKDSKEFFRIGKKLMDEIDEIINELSIYLESDILSLKIGFLKEKESETSNFLLYVETPWFWIIRTGIFKDGIEEEQMKLSKKVKESRNFFKVAEFFNIDWSLLKEEKEQKFQDLIFDLLSLNSSKVKIQPIGKSKASDRGRDFIYIEKIDTFEGEKQFKWLIQCKYSNKSISPSSISGWIDRFVEHRVNGYWLMTNNDITPSLYDQFKDVELNEKYHIKTEYWDRLQIEALLNTYPVIYKKYFINAK